MRADAENDTVVNEEVTVVPPDIKAKVIDYDVAAHGLLIVNYLKIYILLNSIKSEQIECLDRHQKIQ